MRPIPIVIPEEVRSVIQQAADRGESVEQLSQRMADMKLEKIRAIKLLRETKKIGLGEAKELIHYSPAWAFRRESDEAFHEELYQAALQAGYVDLNASANQTEHEAHSLLKTGTGD